jgi:hypothetical protein
MGKVAFFCGRLVRIICSLGAKKIRGGREFWRGRVLGFGAQGVRVGGGESCKAGREFHCSKPPKKARLTIGIDHRGAYIKATRAGVFGHNSFALKG